MPFIDAPQSSERQAALFVLWQTLRFLMTWIAPLLPFTAEDVFQTAKGDLKSLTAAWPDSVHLMDIPTPDDAWANPRILEEMERLRTLRGYVTAGMEKIREKQEAGSSLELWPRLYITDPALYALCTRMGEAALATFMITSNFSLFNHAPKGENEAGVLYQAHPEDQVRLDIRPVAGDKCARCWRWMALNAQQICTRCAYATDEGEAASS